MAEDQKGAGAGKGVNDIPCPPGTVPSGSGCSPAGGAGPVQSGPAANDKSQGVGAGTGPGGQVPWESAPATDAGAGGGGGGGGKGEGRGDKFGEKYGPAQEIMDHLSAILAGEESRFNPEVMQDLYAGVISDAESGKESARQGQYSDLASRGLLRSAAVTGSAQRADLMAAKLRSEGLREIRVKKVMTEWDDKMGALDRSQKWVDSLREYELGKERNQIAREQIGAQLAAASMQVAAQKEMAMMQMANDKEMYEMKMNDAASNRDKCVEFCQQMGDAGCAASCF
jgi:hypothetical protein